MAKIGSFGAAVREIEPDAERDTFDFCGEEFTVHGAIPPMLMLRLGASMAGEMGVIESNAVVYKALRLALTIPADTAEKTPADTSQFDRFQELAEAKACHFDELARLVFALVGIQIAFPTEPQPTSQDGLQATSGDSNSSASATPASGGLRSVDEVLGG